MKNRLLPLFLYGLIFALYACSTDDGFTLSVDTEKYGTVVIDAEAGASSTLTFSAGQAWEASTAADWLTVTPQSGGAGEYTLTLTVTKPNDTGQVRETSINLTAGGDTQRINVSQEEYIRLDESTINLSAAGGDFEINFYSTVPQEEIGIYTMRNCTWIGTPPATRTAEEKGYYLPLTAKANTGGQSRTTTVYLAKISSEDTPLSEQNLLATVTIVQAGELTGEESTDYSADKTVRTIQTHTAGNGIPLVLMGDGFIDKEIANGYYDQVMNTAVENLFTEEPIQSLRDYFDIYAVTAVSRHNNFGDGYETAFSCYMAGGTSTEVGGDDKTVQEYASEVENIDLNNAQVIVILNSSAYAGTNYFYEDGQGNPLNFAIAYCPTIDGMENDNFRRVLVHEAAGHGIGKLHDEYSYEEQGAMPAAEIAQTREEQQNYGWWQNVDFTDKPATVLWSNFLSDSRYANQGLDIFEGACTYWTGAYRSTEESMMRSNIQGFNAPSRHALYNNIIERGEGRTPDLEEFITFDQQTYTPVTTRAAETPSKPFARPRIRTLERE